MQRIHMGASINIPRRFTKGKVNQFEEYATAEFAALLEKLGTLELEYTVTGAKRVTDMKVAVKNTAKLKK